MQYNHVESREFRGKKKTKKREAVEYSDINLSRDVLNKNSQNYEDAPVSVSN